MKREGSRKCKEKKNENFFGISFTNNGLILFIPPLQLQKNYKPTLNKTLFFLPFFFLPALLVEDSSTVDDSDASSLLLPPLQAFTWFCPEVCLRMFKITWCLGAAEGKEGKILGFKLGNSLAAAVGDDDADDGPLHGVLLDGWRYVFTGELGRDVCGDDRIELWALEGLLALLFATFAADATLSQTFLGFAPPPTTFFVCFGLMTNTREDWTGSLSLTLRAGKLVI